jgi:uncharacterized protein YjbJ (UPF0337 family)
MISKGSFASPTLPVLSFARCWKDKIMDKDQVVGSAKQVKGAVEESVGRAVGDAKLESEGRADKAEGKIQKAIGDLRNWLKRK